MENDVLEVTLRGVEEEGPALSATDRRTGQRWHLPGELLSIRYWEFYLYSERNIAIDRYDSYLKGLLQGETRLLLDYDISPQWDRYGLVSQLVLELKGDALEVSVPFKSIHETVAHEYKYLSIDPLPLFGAARRGEEGYMLHGCNRVHYFRRPGEGAVRDEIAYSESFAPAYGLVRDGSALFVQCLSGDFETRLYHHLAAPTEGLYGTRLRWDLRYQVADEIDPVDRAIRMTFLTGEEAGWQGMARLFHRFLKEERGVKTLAQRAAERPAVAYAARALQAGSWCSCKEVKGPFSSERCDRYGRHPLRIINTFDELQRMMRRFKEAGIKELMMLIVGIWRQGHDGLYPDKFPLEAEKGGDEGLWALLKWADEAGHFISPHDNYTDIYETAPSVDLDDSITQPDGSRRRGGVWAGGHCYIQCPRAAYEGDNLKMLTMMQVMGLWRTVYYYDAMPGWLYRCYNPAHPLISRRECGEWMVRLLERAQEFFGASQSEGFPAYAVDAIDVSECSGETSDNESGFLPADGEDGTVPFWQMATHGLALYKSTTRGADFDRWLVRAVAIGGLPYFDIPAMSTVTDEIERAAVAYRRVQPLEDLYYEPIERFELLAPGVTRTTYTNGSRVIANSTKKEATCEGVTVGPFDFARVG